jgi:hypothetical protein
MAIAWLTADRGDAPKMHPFPPDPYGENDDIKTFEARRSRFSDVPLVRFSARESEFVRGTLPGALRPNRPAQPPRTSTPFPEKSSAS